MRAQLDLMPASLSVAALSLSTSFGIVDTSWYCSFREGSRDECGAAHTSSQHLSSQGKRRGRNREHRDSSMIIILDKQEPSAHRRRAGCGAHGSSFTLSRGPSSFQLSFLSYEHAVLGRGPRHAQTLGCPLSEMYFLYADNSGVR